MEDGAALDGQLARGAAEALSGAAHRHRRGGEQRTQVRRPLEKAYVVVPLQRVGCVRVALS